MAQFEVHEVTQVSVEVSDFPVSLPFRCVTLSIIREGGTDTVKLFTRDYNWFVAAGKTDFKGEGHELS